MIPYPWFFLSFPLSSFMIMGLKPGKMITCVGLQSVLKSGMRESVKIFQLKMVMINRRWQQKMRKKEDSERERERDKKRAKKWKRLTTTSLDGVWCHPWFHTIDSIASTFLCQFWTWFSSVLRLSQHFPFTFHGSKATLNITIRPEAPIRYFAIAHYEKMMRIENRSVKKYKECLK